MIIRSTALCLAMITAWLSLAILAMLPGSIATAAVPIGTRLPENIAVVGQTSRLLIIRSDDPSYVRKLYQTGALFVLPARSKTCLDLKGP